jgi:hypothetical protein
MIWPSYRSHNVRSWSDLVEVPSDQRAAPGAENLRNPARSRRAGLMRQFRSGHCGQLYSMVFSA